MKVASIETFLVPPRWLFLKMTTDTGLIGWGEPVVEGRARTVQTAVEELGEYLIGKDPMRIEDHWQTMYRSGFYRGGPVLMSAIAGIDQALWDIKGKYFNAPIYELLGGACRDKVRVYSWIGGDRPNDVAQSATLAKKNGFEAIKMNATEEMHYIDSYHHIDAVIERVATVREAEPELRIGIDFTEVHKAMAKILVKELEPYRLMFVEEPVLPEHNEALRELRSISCIPIATGERMYSRWDFRQVLEEGLVDIIQPDLSHAGGITECKKIFSMAEAYDVAVAPHCPLGPIALASCLQVDATAHNVFIQEQSMGIHYNQGGEVKDCLVDDVYQFEDGYAKLLTEPGLGIQIDEEMVRERANAGHNWRNPVWRNEDGTIAEW